MKELEMCKEENAGTITDANGKMFVLPQVLPSFKPSESKATDDFEDSKDEEALVDAVDLGIVDRFYEEEGIHRGKGALVQCAKSNEKSHKNSPVITESSSPHSER